MLWRKHVIEELFTRSKYTSTSLDIMTSEAQVRGVGAQAKHDVKQHRLFRKTMLGLMPVFDYLKISMENETNGLIFSF